MSGLEALGVAASIIQVADLGTKLSVKLFSFYRQVKNASESLHLLSNEIALVSAILRELGDSLEGEESSKLCSDKAFLTLSLVLRQCREVLTQIQKVIDHNHQQGKNRFQQVTGKIRLVLLEPSLDQLKIKLETLKSTMLLLLNVIMYAGQIRSNNIPNLLEEQRGLIETLLEEDRQKSDPTSPQANSEEQVSDRPGRSTNSTGAQSRAPRASMDNEPAELKEYNILIHSMLQAIDLCKSKLEENRHSRIKNGVLNIHSGEIMRFQLEHGPSVHIDHSLFADQNPESTPHEGHSSGLQEQSSLDNANPTYQSPQSIIPTNQAAWDDFCSTSTTQSASPNIDLLLSASRGNSADPHNRRLSLSSLTVKSIDPPDMLSNSEDKNSDGDGHGSVSSLQVAQSVNGKRIHHSLNGISGRDPSSQTNEYVNSPSDVKEQREHAQKKEEIRLWSADVRAMNSEVGEDKSPTPLRLSPVRDNHGLRAQNTGDRPLQQKDYLSIQSHSNTMTPVPDVLMHKRDNNEDDASVEYKNTPSGPPSAGANIPGQYDRSNPVHSSLEQISSDGNPSLCPWHDAPRDSVQFMEAVQQESYSAATVAFEKRARDLPTGSLTAKNDYESIINFGGTSGRLSIGDGEGIRQSQSRRPIFAQASSKLKRQASDLPITSADPDIQQWIDHLHQHRSSLSRRKLARSPSLTNALSAMSEQMAAIGDNHSARVISSNTEASPNSKPVEACGRSSTAVNQNSEERDSENESQKKSSALSTTPQTIPQRNEMSGSPGDDAQKTTFETFLVPGNLEDLLAQWTTLSQPEIQRGKV